MKIHDFGNIYKTMILAKLKNLNVHGELEQHLYDGKDDDWFITKNICAIGKKAKNAGDM